MKFRSKPVRTRGDSRRRALYSLAPRLACLFRRVLLGAHFPSAPKSFRINTCKSLSKQTTLTLFRINTYEKHRRRGLLLLTRNLKAPSAIHRPALDFVGVSPPGSRITGHLPEGCRPPARMLRFGVP